jgi:spoIIIJ-associated protein
MEIIKIIKEEAENLIKKIIDEFKIDIKQKDKIYQIKIKTDKEASTIIGRHGETIRSIQKLLEVILFKRFKAPINILVDVNDFREKQKEKLEKIAQEMAQKTMEEKRANFIRNLSSYERRLIHEYISNNYPLLTTYSIGEGKDRQLVIDFRK